MRVNDMSENQTPKILTFRFHEFRPSDRRALEEVLKGEEGRAAYVDALRIYLQGWAGADWLTEYDIERIGKWTATYFPEVSRAVEDMATSELRAAPNERARKTFQVMAEASRCDSAVAPRAASML